MNDKQPEALRMADALEQYKYSLCVERDATAAELRRLHQHELALNVFIKKTKWVQDAPQSGELGMHYADILRVRIEKLERVNAELLDALKLMRQSILNPISVQMSPRQLAEYASAAIAKAEGRA